LATLYIIMKHPRLTIILTILGTWLVVTFYFSLDMAKERMWLVSAVKVPGRMALFSIQVDLEAGRTKQALAKLKRFQDEWSGFERGTQSFTGRGIGSIMPALYEVERQFKAEQNSAPKP
jgi:hypothetical protein